MLHGLVVSYIWWALATSGDGEIGALWIVIRFLDMPLWSLIRESDHPLGFAMIGGTIMWFMVAMLLQSLFLLPYRRVRCSHESQV